HHWIDPRIPIAESLGEVSRLQREGKVRFIGVCNYGVHELYLAIQSAAITSIQNELSRRNRTPEYDGTLRHSQALDLALIPWSPLNGIDGAKTLGQGDPALSEVA